MDRLGQRVGRRNFIAALSALGVSALANAVEAKAFTLGLLWIEQKPSKLLPPLLSDLRARGYEPGRNLRILDFTVSSYEALPEAAARLVAQKPTVIVANGGTASQAAHKATQTIPIIAATVGEPQKLGIGRSLSRPGSNLTGISMVNLDVVGKRIQLLKSTFPALKHIAVVYYAQSEGEALQVSEAQQAAKRLGMKATVVPLRTAEDILPTIRGLPKQRVDGIFFVGSSMLRANRDRLVMVVAQARLPATYNDATYPEAGGLMSYGQDLARNFYRLGAYVDKIFRGASPADMPIEQFSDAELVINLRVAKQQKWTIPDAVLVSATRVID